jgi:hypothetical protein
VSPSRYRLVIAGELGPRYAAAFDGMALHAHDGETEITGPIIDPSHLQGLLERVASLGLTVQSLTRLETANGESDPQLHTPTAGITDLNHSIHRNLEGS